MGTEAGAVLERGSGRSAATQRHSPNRQHYPSWGICFEGQRQQGSINPRCTAILDAATPTSIGGQSRAVKKLVYSRIMVQQKHRAQQVAAPYTVFTRLDV